jgi:60 kDa SS-A/Ro ribonucleoprotein
MINRNLTSRTAATASNAAGGRAYALPPREALAQLAVTGCLNDTFYVEARAQLDEMLALCAAVEPRFVARAALYARLHGRMKDTPVVLLAWLASTAPELAEAIFARVVDGPAQLRSFVQVMRSGLTGRQSLGTRPKRWVQQWLEAASDEQLVQGLVGASPSLADVIRMVHPRAASIERSALYGYVIGRPAARELLPQALQDLQRFRADPGAPVPRVPFQLLTGVPLSTAHWNAIASQAGWTMTRMNLNTFQRHGVFDCAETTRRVAERLRNRRLIERAAVFPYQLLTAYRAASGVPAAIRDALRAATEIAVRNVPRFSGSVAVAVDVSGSMGSPVTGYRQGASTATRCIDVAGLMAASVLSRNPGAIVLPFNNRVRPWERPARSGVVATAEALANLLGGGTAVSAPLERLNQLGLAPDITIVISDNQSWMDSRSGAAATASQQAWQRLRRRNPAARLVCIDLQPYPDTQLADEASVLNVGGFSDAVFGLVDRFARGAHGAGHWAREIEAMEL